MRLHRDLSGLWLLVALFIVYVVPEAAQVPRAPRSPVDWVNPYIGTGGSNNGPEYGGTMPLVTTPFGMTNWTPQTRQNKVSVSSYAYEDSTISGFIGTHQPAIWMGDYGYITLMPEVNSLKLAPDDRKQSFLRKDEIATPYYYSVLTDAGKGEHTKTELTATNSCGFLRFTFPRDAKPIVMVEATRKGVTGLVAIDVRRHEITGYNPDRMDADLGPSALPHFKGYFVVQFRNAFSDYGTYQGAGARLHSSSIEGNNVGAYVEFAPGMAGPVEVKVGTSFISIKQARANLKSEMPSWDFRSLRDHLKSTWNHKLGIATIDGATSDQRTIFYTGLYHALLYPKLISEQGWYYSAFDDRVHQGTSYTSYSLWDTYRAENSLLTIFAPERVDGMVQALLQDYQEGGWMPKWPNPALLQLSAWTRASETSL